MLQKLPQYHSCSTLLVERKILIDETVMKRNHYLVDYCPKCEIYKFNNFESRDPQVVGDHIVELQRDTNKTITRFLFDRQNEKP